MSSIMRKSVDIVNHPRRAPTDAGDDVLDSVHALMHAYRSLQYRALRDGPHDITHMDAKVLGFFARHPGATQRDLALHSGRDKAQLARLVKSLCDKGLLARTSDAEDRRQVRLALTDAGRDVQQVLRTQACRLTATATAGLTEADRAQLATLLERVRANLEAAG